MDHQNQSSIIFSPYFNKEFTKRLNFYKNCESHTNILETMLDHIDIEEVEFQYQVYAIYSNDVLLSLSYFHEIDEDYDLSKLAYVYMTYHPTFSAYLFNKIRDEMVKREIKYLEGGDDLVYSTNTGAHIWCYIYKDYDFEDKDIINIILFLSLFDLNMKDHKNNTIADLLTKMKVWPRLKEKMNLLEVIKLNDSVKEADLNTDAQGYIDDFEIDEYTAGSNILYQIVLHLPNNSTISPLNNPKIMAYKLVNPEFIFGHIDVYKPDKDEINGFIEMISQSPIPKQKYIKYITNQIESIKDRPVIDGNILYEWAETFDDYHYENVSYKQLNIIIDFINLFQDKVYENLKHLKEMKYLYPRISDRLCIPVQ